MVLTPEEHRARARERQRQWRKKNPEKWQQIVNRHYKKRAEQIRLEEMQKQDEEESLTGWPNMI